MTIQSSFLFIIVVHTRSGGDDGRPRSVEPERTDEVCVYITSRGIVYAVELLGKQYRHLYKLTVLFCSISEPSSFPIAAILVRKHAGM